MDPYNGDERTLGSILESLPDPVVAALEVRDAWRRQLAESTAGLEFIVSDLARWPVGSRSALRSLTATPGCTPMSPRRRRRSSTRST